MIGHFFAKLKKTLLYCQGSKVPALGAGKDPKWWKCPQAKDDKPSPSDSTSELLCEVVKRQVLDNSHKAWVQCHKLTCLYVIALVSIIQGLILVCHLSKDQRLYSTEQIRLWWQQCSNAFSSVTLVKWLTVKASEGKWMIILEKWSSVLLRLILDCFFIVLSLPDNEIVCFLKVQLAEAINLQDKNQMAQIQETARCVSRFDPRTCRKLLAAIAEDYR